MFEKSWRINTQQGRWFAFIVAVSILVACSEEGIYAEDYNQACVFAEDCIPVMSGDPCDCDVPCGAINRLDKAKYQADL